MLICIFSVKKHNTFKRAIVELNDISMYCISTLSYNSKQQFFAEKIF